MIVCSVINSLHHVKSKAHIAWKGSRRQYFTMCVYATLYRLLSNTQTPETLWEIFPNRWSNSVSACLVHFRIARFESSVLRSEFRVFLVFRRLFLRRMSGPESGESPSCNCLCKALGCTMRQHPFGGNDDGIPRCIATCRDRCTLPASFCISTGISPLPLMVGSTRRYHPRTNACKNEQLLPVLCWERPNRIFRRNLTSFLERLRGESRGSRRAENLRTVSSGNLQLLQRWRPASCRKQRRRCNKGAIPFWTKLAKKRMIFPKKKKRQKKKQQKKFWSA